MWVYIVTEITINECHILLAYIIDVRLELYQTFFLLIVQTNRKTTWPWESPDESFAAFFACRLQVLISCMGVPKQGQVC